MLEQKNLRITYIIKAFNMMITSKLCHKRNIWGEYLEHKRYQVENKNRLFHWNSDCKSRERVKWAIVSQTACRGWNVCTDKRKNTCVSFCLCGTEHTWQNMFVIMKWILHHKLHMQMHNYVLVDFVINWLSWKPDTHNKPLSTSPAHTWRVCGHHCSLYCRTTKKHAFHKKNPHLLLIIFLFFVNKSSPVYKQQTKKAQNKGWHTILLAHVQIKQRIAFITTTDRHAFI